MDKNERWKERNDIEKATIFMCVLKNECQFEAPKAKLDPFEDQFFFRQRTDKSN